MSEYVNQNNCDIIQDLLPLYQDNVCSDSSKKMVEEHLKECVTCQSVLQQLKNTKYDDVLSDEKTSVLDTHAKKEKRYSTTIGIVTAGILMIPMIVCLICNIAVGHALDWFFIVLASLLVLASVTVLPLLAQTKKGLWTIMGFTLSILFLLLVICIYTKGNWFLLAGIPTVFGLSVIFMPYVIYQIPLPDILKNQKGLLVMIWDTIWLYALILICGIYSSIDSYWNIALPITTFCLVLPWGIFLCARFCKVHPMTKAGIITIMVGIFSAFVNDVIHRILYGSWHIDILDANFSELNSYSINGVCLLGVLIVSIIVGIILIAVGINLKKKNNVS